MTEAEIYEYTAPWLIYALNWCNDPSTPFRLSIGSFVEDYSNSVQILQLNQNTGSFDVLSQLEHPYPPTKLMWAPSSCPTTSLFATTSDFLRIYQVNEKNQVKEKCSLNNNKSPGFCAPLTSFDWNTVEPSIVGTSSIDTTCTIWNLETQQAITQLIAHDKEVYDIAFGRDKDTFASVGADGSVRMFDLRSLDHSKIIYESNDNPLLRVSWNKQDDHYLATIAMDSSKAIILDTRVPSLPAAEIQIQGRESGCLNALSWAPHSSCHICTAGDDKTALIWDLSCLPEPVSDPILAYKADGEINQLQWSSEQPSWIAISFDTKLQILRV